MFRFIFLMSSAVFILSCSSVQKPHEFLSEAEFQNNFPRELASETKVKYFDIKHQEKRLVAVIANDVDKLYDQDSLELKITTQGTEDLQ